MNLLPPTATTREVRQALFNLRSTPAGNLRRELFDIEEQDLAAAPVDIIKANILIQGEHPQARAAALDVEEEERRNESQRRRQHAAQIVLKKLRYKLETCEPKHTAGLQGQIAAILNAHPTLT